MNESELPAYFGEGGRLTVSAGQALIDSAYKHDCEDANVLLPGLHEADLAHGIALVEAGVIPSDVAPILFRGLLDLREMTDLPIRPELGDVYNSKEAVLKDRIGAAAGWIHAGRPRREAVNIAFLLAVRERLLGLVEAHLEMAETAVHLAEAHRRTLMPDFTYLQHAHPTTFGHYLLTFVYPVFRDLERLQHCYRVFNTSPAGSGSVNGTRLPIDRDRLGSLLGFDEVTPHTRDAMWQPDSPIELMAAIVALLININRLGEELQIWTTSEFDFVEFGDELARASVIMPQKKNPYGLAWIRGLTGTMLGKMSSFAAVGKTYSGNPDSRVFIYGELPRSLDRTTEALRLIQATLGSIRLNEDVLRKRAGEGFSQATDLAELIMTARQVDYRTAHQIVGRIVRQALELKIEASDVTPQMLDEASTEITGKPLGFTVDELSTALDPAQIVASRQGRGGASYDRVSEMIAECRTRLAEEREWLRKASESVSVSQQKLLTLSRQLASS